MKNTELGAESKIYPDNPSNSSNMERDQNESCLCSQKSKCRP